MVVRFVFQNGDKIGRQFKNNTVAFGKRQNAGVSAAAHLAADDIEKKGRADMRRAGNFKSERWQQGFRALVSFPRAGDVRIRITHAVSYWKVFQFGAVIKGKPLLWIPLDFATDAQGKNARDYPGKLFRVDRKGKAPLLMSDDGPKYFGKEQVKIPKKFHLREIAAEVSRNMGKYFKRAMRNGR